MSTTRIKSPTNPVVLIVAALGAVIVAIGVYEFFQYKVVLPQQQKAYVAAMKQVKAEEALISELSSLREQFFSTSDREKQKALADEALNKADGLDINALPRDKVRTFLEFLLAERRLERLK